MLDKWIAAVYRDTCIDDGCNDIDINLTPPQRG